jgi:hypothetical protein
MSDLCVDVPDGDTSHVRLTQFWDCVPGNVNQQWGARLVGYETIVSSD